MRKRRRRKRQDRRKDRKKAKNMRGKYEGGLYNIGRTELNLNF